MKPTEILALLPGFGDAKASAILDSPAWKMPCRYAENPASLVRDTEEIASPLSIRITIGDEKHILCIAKNAAFAELAVLWDKRPSVPDTIILALVEKECGALLQTIENTMRKTVKLAGLAETDGESAGRNAGFRLDAAPGQEPIRFSISASDGRLSRRPEKHRHDIRDGPLRQGRSSRDSLPPASQHGRPRQDSPGEFRSHAGIFARCGRVSRRI